MSRRARALKGCEEQPFELSQEEAWLVLEPYYLATREAFLVTGFPRIARVTCKLGRAAHDSPRHFAMTKGDGTEVTIAPHLAGMPEGTVVAILGHELGHAADFLYPARFQLREGALIEWEGDWSQGSRLPGGVERDGRAAYNHTKQWRDRNDDEVEMTADAIAERALGRPIFYRGACLLQSIEGGVRPRPVGLR